MDIFGLEFSAPSPQFLALAWNFRAARILQVAVRLRLFTALEERPTDAFMLAKRLHCDGDMTERLLIALAGLELVRHDMDVWRNTLAASLYLVEGQPLYQGDGIELAAQEWDQYKNLERLVRDGRNSNHAFSFGEDDASQKRYRQAVHGLAVAGLAQRIARLAPLAGRRDLLEVGGAPGTVSIALAQRHSALRVTLMDTESALPQSKAVIAQFGMKKQIQAVANAWREKSFGTNAYDAVLLSRLPVGAEDALLAALMRGYDALRPNGVIILHTYLLDNDLNGSGEATFRHLLDNAYTLEQLCSFLQESGFERIAVLHRHATEGDVLVGYKQNDAPQEEPNALVEVATPEISLIGSGGNEYDEDVLLATHRRAWSGVIERLN